jgi:hypothetical protein
MILIVYKKYNLLYSLIVGILQKNFPVKLVLYNTVDIVEKYKKELKTTTILVYNTEEELNTIFNQELVHGYSLVLKNEEEISISNTCAYDIYIKIVDESNKIISIETNQFKKRGSIKEDFLVDVIIECFKNGYPNMGFLYDNNYYILRGKEETLKDIPVLKLLNVNETQNSLLDHLKNSNNNINSNSNNFNNNSQLNQLQPNCINIFPITNWTSPDNFIKHWNKFKPTNSKINFTLSNNAPLALVVNSAPIKTKGSNTLYFMMEPNGEVLYESFLNQYDEQSNRLMYNGSHSKNHLNLQEYWLNNSVEELLNPDNDFSVKKRKNKVLSVCVSDRYVDPGHKYRIDLIRKLDEGCSKNKYPFELHIYGKCKSLNFKNYKGECPEKDKSKALYEYKYHFTAENHQINNYVTEKFYDALMSETYLFYLGAPNIEEFYSGCYTKLTGNIDDDIVTIVKEIEEDVYSKRIENIKSMKRMSLITHNMFYRLESILTCNQTLFIKLHITNYQVEINSKKYLNDGWNIITGCMLQNDAMINYSYLEAILTNMMNYNLGLFLCWDENDKYSLFDKLCDKYSLLRYSLGGEEKVKEKLFIIKMDGNNKDLFQNNIYIPISTKQVLFSRIKENKRTLEELCKDILIY